MHNVLFLLRLRLMILFHFGFARFRIHDRKHDPWDKWRACLIPIIKSQREIEACSSYEYHMCHSVYTTVDCRLHPQHILPWMWSWYFVGNRNDLNHNPNRNSFCSPETPTHFLILISTLFFADCRPKQSIFCRSIGFRTYSKWISK